MPAVQITCVRTGEAVEVLLDDAVADWLDLSGWKIKGQEPNRRFFERKAESGEFQYLNRVVAEFMLGEPPQGAYYHCRMKDGKSWWDLRSSNLYWDIPRPATTWNSGTLPYPYCGA